MAYSIRVTTFETNMDFEHKVGAMDDEDIVVGEKEEKNWKGIVISLLVIGSISGLIILSIVLSTTNNDVDNHRMKLDLDSIIGDHYRVKRFNGLWISENEIAYVEQNGNIAIYDAKLNMTTSILVKTSDKTLHTMASFELSADRKLILFVSDLKKELGMPVSGRFAIFNISSQTVIYLDELIKISYPQKVPKIQYASWIADTNSIVFIDNNDIYYIPNLAYDGKIIQLTTPNDYNTVSHGMPDSLYRLNIFTKTNDAAIWWSPDASHLAYLTFDDIEVEPSPIEYYDSYITDTNVNPKIYYGRYPRAGSKNPRVKVNVVNLNSQNEIEQIHVNPPDEIVTQQQDDRFPNYITYVEWLPTNELLVMWSSRAQNSSLLSICGNKRLDSRSWRCEMLIIFEQKVPIMRNSKETILTGYNQNKTRLTFLALPRPDTDVGDHYYHYYHVGMVRSGERYVKFLSHGEYDVDRLVLYDSITDSLYYEAKSTTQPERHLYRVIQTSLLNSSLQCLTCNLKEPCGYNHAYVSPLGSNYVVHECLGPSVPVTRLRRLPDMTSVSILGTNSHIEQMLQVKQIPQEKLINIKMQLPYDVHMKMYIPTENEEEKDKKFPLLIESSDLEQRNVWSKFEIDWGKYLASRKQLVYVKIDCIRARNLASSSSLGSTDSDGRFISTSPIFNSKDQVDIIRYLIDAVDEFPFIDRKRIAIWGPTSTASYVALATTADDDTKSIQCTMAVAPITNWKYLDTYTAEHFLGSPWIDSNYLKYEKANLLKRGYDFATRKVLIIHGTADEKVHVQHSMQFTKALTEHFVAGGVIHQMQLYPDADHSLSDVRQHLFRTMDGFLDRCFYQKPIAIKATEWKKLGKVRVRPNK